MVASAPNPVDQLGVGEPIEHGPTPPDHIRVGIEAMTSGRGHFVYRQSYFTEAQVRDPRWEVRRREKMNQIRMCPSYRIIRREIRWYDATPLSGERCAAIIYIGLCNGARRGPDPDVETDRITLLRRDPDPPIEPGCGERESYRFDTRPPDEQRRAAMLSSEASCLPGEWASDEPIRVGPETRFHVRALAQPEFAAAAQWQFGADATGQLGRLVEGYFYNADRVAPQVFESPIADNGVNVFVTVEFTLSRGGEPYCIQLSARQGAHSWRRGIERAGFLQDLVRLEREVGLTRTGLARDPSRLWSPSFDTSLLVDSLGAYLVAHAAPDREFRRGWR